MSSDVDQSVLAAAKRGGENAEHEVCTAVGPLEPVAGAMEELESTTILRGD